MYPENRMSSERRSLQKTCTRTAERKIARNSRVERDLRDGGFTDLSGEINSDWGRTGRLGSADPEFRSGGPGRSNPEIRNDL